MVGVGVSTPCRDDRLIIVPRVQVEELPFFFFLLLLLFLFWLPCP